MKSLPAVLGFAAFSGAGKTTLLMQLIPLLRATGLRSGLIKHGHHTFEIDTPGKDSDLLRQAGAVQVVVASARRTLLIKASSQEPELQTLVHQMASSELDIILVEGFKHHPIAKIELHRPSLGYPLLCQKDRTIIAVATDAPLPMPISIPLLDLNDPPAIAAFIQGSLLAGKI